MGGERKCTPSQNRLLSRFKREGRTAEHPARVRKGPLGVNQGLALLIKCTFPAPQHAPWAVCLCRRLDYNHLLYAPNVHLYQQHPNPASRRIFMHLSGLRGPDTQRLDIHRIGT
jgi:hypothetical protein